MNDTAEHYSTLPAFFREEDCLRRLLIRRAEGLPVGEVLRLCEVAESEWSRVRAVARGHGRHAGDRAVAEAFIARFDSLAARALAKEPLFTAEEGALLAADIARWRLPG